MDAHGIEVFNGADDDDVVLGVAHHLEFEFLPPDHRPLDENLPHGTGAQPPFGVGLELFPVVGNVPARAAQGE